MALTRVGLINAAIGKAIVLTDYISDIDKRFELRQQMILEDESLKKEEKSQAIRILCNNHEFNKVFLNEGTKRLCENCQLECLAITYCEIASEII